MSIARRLALLICLTVASVPAALAGKLTVAAAADMKFAMADIAAAFNQSHPGDKVDVVFGSSGKIARLTTRAAHELQVTIGKPVWLQVKSVALVE